MLACNKTFLIKIFLTRSMFFLLDFMQEFNSSQIFLAHVLDFE